MFLLSLLVGCRSTVHLGFVLVAPDDLVIRQAYARVQRYRLRDCDGDVTREWVGQRLDLLATTPEVVRDRAWCGIDVEFKEAPLFGPALGWRGDTASGIGFDVAMSPGTVSLDTPFGGTGDDQVILLDLGMLMPEFEVEQLAYETDPPLEEVVLSEGSDWSQEHRPLLPDAMTVLSVPQASQRSDWSIVIIGPPVESSGGCGAAREDTSTWWGDSANPDSTDPDSGSGYLYDSGDTLDGDGPSSGGCSCSTDRDSGQDTGEDASDAEEDTQGDTGEDASGGCLGGEDDTGDSGSGWVGLERRVGLAMLMGLFWLRRRRE